MVGAPRTSIAKLPSFWRVKHIAQISDERCPRHPRSLPPTASPLRVIADPSFPPTLMPSKQHSSNVQPSNDINPSNPSCSAKWQARKPTRRKLGPTTALPATSDVANLSRQSTNSPLAISVLPDSVKVDELARHSWMTLTPALKNTSASFTRDLRISVPAAPSGPGHRKGSPHYPCHC